MIIFSIIWAVIGLIVFFKTWAWLSWLLRECKPTDVENHVGRNCLNVKAAQDTYRKVFPAPEKKE